MDNAGLRMQQLMSHFLHLYHCRTEIRNAFALRSSPADAKGSEQTVSSIDVVIPSVYARREGAVHKSRYTHFQSYRIEKIFCIHFGLGHRIIWEAEAEGAALRARPPPGLVPAGHRVNVPQGFMSCVRLRTTREPPCFHGANLHASVSTGLHFSRTALITYIDGETVETLAIMVQNLGLES